MGTLRKGLAALAVLLAVGAGGMIASGTAWAHHGGDRDGRGHCSDREGGWKKHRGDRMAKALGLTGEQKEKVKEIFRKNREETESLRKEMVSERRELRELVRSEKTDEAAIREEAKKIGSTSGELAIRRAKTFREVRAILTPEQVKKYDEFREKRDRRNDRSEKHGEEEHPNGK